MNKIDIRRVAVASRSNCGPAARRSRARFASLSEPEESLSVLAILLPTALEEVEGGVRVEEWRWRRWRWRRWRGWRRWQR